jgi:hypothetical protein
MKNHLVLVFIAALSITAQGVAQRDRGHAPKAPSRRERPDAKPVVEPGRGGDTPHVNGDRWYGHAAPNDARFRLDRPFPHGRFAQVGRSHRFTVTRLDREFRRLWFPGGFGFEIALWDWPLVAQWCWDCGDDFVVYADPDHLGWYLLVNTITGEYVHVQYLGS